MVVMLVRGIALRHTLPSTFPAAGHKRACLAYSRLEHAPGQVGPYGLPCSPCYHVHHPHHNAVREEVCQVTKAGATQVLVVLAVHRHTVLEVEQLLADDADHWTLDHLGQLHTQSQTPAAMTHTRSTPEAHMVDLPGPTSLRCTGH